MPGSGEARRRTSPAMLGNTAAAATLRPSSASPHARGKGPSPAALRPHIASGTFPAALRGRSSSSPARRDDSSSSSDSDEGYQRVQEAVAALRRVMDDGISQVGTDIERLKRELEESLRELDGKINIMAAMGEHTLRLLESLVYFSNGNIPPRPIELNHLGPSYTIEPFHPEGGYEEELSHQPSAQRQPTFDERLAEVAARVNLSLDLARRIAEACPSKDPQVGDLGPSFGTCTWVQLQAIIDLVVSEHREGQTEIPIPVIPILDPVGAASMAVDSERPASMLPMPAPQPMGVAPQPMGTAPQPISTAPQPMGFAAAPDLGASKRPKMLAPAKFSGDKDTDVSDFLFTVESYLTQSGYAREDYAVCAMGLLEKQALSTYIAFAQPLARPITWEEFKNCLSIAYARPDRELASRKSLFGGEVTQTTSVADYLRRFRQVLARCGTSPDPQSLGDLFWKNLKPAIREKCRIDPQTGKFWTSFEAMAE